MLQCLSMVHSRSTSHLCGCDEGHKGLHRCWKCGLVWGKEHRVNVLCSETVGSPFHSPVPVSHRAGCTCGACVGWAS